MSIERYQAMTISKRMMSFHNNKTFIVLILFLHKHFPLVPICWHILLHQNLTIIHHFIIVFQIFINSLYAYLRIFRFPFGNPQHKSRHKFQITIASWYVLNASLIHKISHFFELYRLRFEIYHEILARHMFIVFKEEIPHCRYFNLKHIPEHLIKDNKSPYKIY